MTEEECYTLYLENQDLTPSPKASIRCLDKFKPDDEPRSSKQENSFVPKKAQGTAKAKYGVTTMHLNKQLLRYCKVVDCDTLSFELAESD